MFWRSRLGGLMRIGSGTAYFGIRMLWPALCSGSGVLAMRPPMSPMLRDAMNATQDASTISPPMEIHQVVAFLGIHPLKLILRRPL